MPQGVQIRLAVDIGGTFTDVVVAQGDVLTSVKVSTTPGAPEKGFIAGSLLALEQAGVAPDAVTAIFHGTTLATNALIERRGARTALVTTKGFRDSVEIGYEARYDQYDLELEKPAPLVPRNLRFTVAERVSASGEILRALEEQEVQDLVSALRGEAVEAVAVGLLHAYANPVHEKRVRDILKAALPDLYVTLSAEVCPEIREYERLSTAVANAYVQPLMARYLTVLEVALRKEGFDCPVFLATSAAGMTDLKTAVRFPIRLVESGPSGGAVLAMVTAERLGERKVLSYDMGGTTAKVCLIEDFQALTSRNFEAARNARFTKGSGLPLRIPAIEMIEIGAGGGSIGRLDALGRIAVGPESAGAEPGPASYGKGGEAPTVTDANLILGRLDSDSFAGGRISLDAAQAESALARDIGGPMGIETPQAAQGLCDMVDETMANAARVHASERGKDLREWTVIAFGGAGPLHAGQLATKLGVRRLIIPADPGVGSAVGFLHAPISYETVRSCYMTLASFDAARVDSILAELAEEAREIVCAGAPDEPLQERRGALMRYCGQGHEVEITLPPGPVEPESGTKLRRAFEQRYAELFGRALAGHEIEVLTWSVCVWASPPRIGQVPATAVPSSPAPAARETRLVFDPASDTFSNQPAYWRGELTAGCFIDGPALVAEAQTTTIVPAGFRCRVDGAGNLILEETHGQETKPRASAMQGLAPLREQVMWSRLQAVVDEQAGTLMRTAFSPIVRESGDLSAGIFDLEGRMLVQAVTGTPGHVNTMATACAKFFDFFPKSKMRPGDIFLTNDPWLGAGHLNDFVLLMPCFHEGALVGFASCTSHLVDIGGHCLGPTGSDIHDEGLYVPPLRLVEAGRLNETFMALLEANSRMPEQAIGDVHALIACCEAGARRLEEMMAEFALEDLQSLSKTILETSQAATCDRIRAIPDGTYCNEMTIDGYDFEVTLKARLVIHDDKLSVDFYDCPGLSAFGINVPLNYAEAYTVFGIKCLVAPDIPNNHGALRPFSVTAPSGSLLNAPKPAPVCSRHIIGQLLPDLVLGCLHHAAPRRAPAEGASTLWDLPIKGHRHDIRGGRGLHFAAELVHNGGTGARSSKDGLSATAFPSGVLGSQVEITESTTPILIARREYRCDSGGPGRFRGGLGQSLELEACGETALTLFGTVDRVKHPARGREAGKPGAKGRLRLGKDQSFSGKGRCDIPAGVRLFVETPGGGGYGEPLTRDPARVAFDFSQGLISRDAAFRDYGVVLRDDGSVDEKATETARNGHSRELEQGTDGANGME